MLHLVVLPTSVPGDHCAYCSCCLFWGTTTMYKLAGIQPAMYLPCVMCMCHDDVYVLGTLDRGPKTNQPTLQLHPESMAIGHGCTTRFILVTSSNCGATSALLVEQCWPELWMKKPTPTPQASTDIATLELDMQHLRANRLCGFHLVGSTILALGDNSQVCHQNFLPCFERCFGIK